MPGPQALRLNPRLHLRHWDDGTVVFDPASGDTHLLTEDAARLMRALQAGQTLPEVANDVLADLRALGLIEQAMP